MLYCGRRGPPLLPDGKKKGGEKKKKTRNVLPFPDPLSATFRKARFFPAERKENQFRLEEKKEKAQGSPSAAAPVVGERERR